MLALDEMIFNNKMEDLVGVWGETGLSLLNALFFLLTRTGQQLNED